MIQIGHRSIRHAILFLASFSFAATLAAADIPPTGKPIWLFDGKSLEQFDTVVLGRGLNNDQDGVFRIHDGMVHVSGTPYGYFITKKDYGDFYLRAEFKWGEATHAPRKDMARDSGILYHVTGAGVVGPGSIWPKSIEFQIMEGSTGDVILVGEAELTVNGVTKPDDSGIQFDRFNKTPWRPGGAAYKAPLGYRDPGKEVEKPHGQWNVLEMLSDGDHIRYWVNGTFVMEGTDASLTRGKILFQSEGAELFYRNIELRPLKKKQR